MLTRRHSPSAKSAGCDCALAHRSARSSAACGRPASRPRASRSASATWRAAAHAARSCAPGRQVQLPQARASRGIMLSPSALPGGRQCEPCSSVMRAQHRHSCLVYHEYCLLFPGPAPPAWPPQTRLAPSPASAPRSTAQRSFSPRAVPGARAVTGRCTPAPGPGAGRRLRCRTRRRAAGARAGSVRLPQRMLSCQCCTVCALMKPRRAPSGCTPLWHAHPCGMQAHAICPGRRVAQPPAHRACSNGHALPAPSALLSTSISAGVGSMCAVPPRRARHGWELALCRRAGCHQAALRASWGERGRRRVRT